MYSLNSLEDRPISQAQWLESIFMSKFDFFLFIGTFLTKYSCIRVSLVSSEKNLISNYSLDNFLDLPDDPKYLILTLN